MDEVLDIVHSLLPAGAVRDAYADRWLRIELTAPLHRRNVRTLPRTQRNAFYREISRVIRTRYQIEAVRASRAQTRVTAAVARRATPREFWRFDRALAETSVHAWRQADDVRLRLFVDGRERPLTTRLSGLLRASVPRIATAVIADLAEDPLLLSETPEPPPQAKALTLQPVVGPRRVTIADERRRPLLTEVGVFRFLNRSKLLARRLLGSRAETIAQWRRRIARR